MSIVRGTVNANGGGGGGGSSSTFSDDFPTSGTAAGALNPAGDLAPLNLDGAGNLKVAVTGAGSGGTSSVDGDTYAASVSAGTPILAAVDDTSPAAAAENKLGIVRMTPQRGIHANLRSVAGVEIGTAGNPIRTDPTGATIQPIASENQLDFDTSGGTDPQSLFGIAIPSALGAVAGGTAANPLRTDPTGTTTQPVSLAAIPLPPGAATEATLAAVNLKIPDLGQQLAAGSSPVVLTAIQLATLTPPAAISGFATAAKQDTIIAAVDGVEAVLATIDADTSVLAAAGATISSTPLIRVAVFDASNAQVTSFGGSGGGGGLTDAQLRASAVPISAAALPLPTGAATETTLAAQSAKIPAQGQALAAASMPVVLTAIQVATLTPPAAITGFATSALQTTGNSSLASLDTKSPGLGQALAAASVPVVLTAIQVAALTPPAALTTLPVTNAGVFGVQLASNLPLGTVAHDGVDSGAPVKVGAKAIINLKNTTLVSSGDRTDLQSDLDGALLTRPQTTLGDTISDAISDTAGSSVASAIFTAVASTKNYITAVDVFRTDAGTTTQFVDFRDGVGGAVIWRMPLPPNGGSMLANQIPIFKTSTNTALAYDVSSALTTVYINVSGFQSKV